MQKTTRNHLRSIHEVLNEAPKQKGKYKISSRNSPGDNSLRALLLELHTDSKLAEFLRESRVIGENLYDPDPDNEVAHYLSWNYSKGAVQFAYQQPVWGIGGGGDRTPFEEFEGRFYANGTEMLELFPTLTADTLEEGITKAIRYDKDFRERSN
ncbi:hypothetical protein HZA97_00410 [Candidatus Woesearchaeota archaeon]|nr:hypothetical protein [Candidatus Woesearchaeota archaeon]